MLITSLITFGVVYGSLVALCFAYGGELTFPLQPALVVGTMTMASEMFAFFQSNLAIYILSEGQDDHLLDENDLTQVRRWRSMLVFSMNVPAALIAFCLSYFIREDLRRKKHGEEITTPGQGKNYEGDDEDNIASDDELSPLLE